MRQYFLDLSTQSVHNRLNKLQSYSLPSNQYIDLTLGTTGQYYTAPADGWVAVSFKLRDNNFVSVSIGANYITYQLTGVNIQSAYYINSSLPVSKGTSFYIAYDGNMTLSRFRFVYAAGSAPQS